MPVLADSKIIFRKFLVLGLNPIFQRTDMYVSWTAGRWHGHHEYNIRDVYNVEMPLYVLADNTKPDLLLVRWICSNFLRRH